MSFAAGVTLQDGKYVIQTTLNQTVYGTTYAATHQYLDQTVILQTLNEVLRQRPDFTQLQQQVRSAVRLFARSMAPYSILDYFEEEGMPFVVLQSTAKTPPTLESWLPLSVDLNNHPKSPVNAESSTQLQQETIAIIPPPAATSAGVGKSSEFERVSQQPLAEAAHEAAHGLSNGATQDVATLAVAPVKAPVPGKSAAPMKAARRPASSSVRRRFPRAVAMTTVITGCVGLGIGTALRFDSSASESHRSTPIGASLFSREQSFPDKDDWPITEVPQYSPENSTAEEPVYRVNSPSNYRVNSSPDYYAPSPPTYHYTPPAPDPLPSVKADPSPLPPIDLKSKLKNMEPVRPSRPAPIETTPDAVAPSPSSLPPIAPRNTTPEPIAPAPVPQAAPVAPVAPAPPAPTTALPLAPKSVQSDAPIIFRQ